MEAKAAVADERLIQILRRGRFWLDSWESEVCDETSSVEVIEFETKKRRVERSSYEGLTEDALAYGAEEGRGKLRKAAERSKHPGTRRYPNEGTQRE